MTLHPIQRRWQAEELLRRRRSSEHRRYAAPQRSGRIDPNPHQIEAVIFALSRLGDGGCILADEVGLGKTIEAGLVIAQLRAEGARRILLITPKTLLGQWRQELYALFGIHAVDGISADALEGEGVFLVGREAAGSERGQQLLQAAPAFDLVVIDEAHEIFGGLYKRFDAAGLSREQAPVAQTAGRVFELVQASQVPVLLLTATPIQNSLAELWALVQYVDPQSTLLGDLRTFRQTFCAGDDRVLAEGQEDELRRRISVVLRRTLRRQAQEFLSKPFVARRARLFEYPMGPEERALYEDVTAYLLTPNVAAFPGNQRRLLLIAFQRRMASSTAALASSLENVAQRLERMLTGWTPDKDLIGEWVGDLEDEDLELPAEPGEARAAPPPTLEKIEAELERVRSFIARAKAVRRSGKSEALLQAARLTLQRQQGSGKMVIFTESLVTQDHLRDLLIAEGVAGEEEITLFRGHNASPRANQALERWQSEVGQAQSARSRPPRDVALRLALVHELQSRSKILISTEAGAKGLNLQFCETVINYDLPWNPQRIEQRIGRCHRYGQTRDVTVINFIAQGNEAEALMFDILAKKLELFGNVFGASDEILHQAGSQSPEVLASALGMELETGLRKIWQLARTAEDLEQEMRSLRDKIGEARSRFDEEQARTTGLIESYFDEEVRKVFTDRRAELPRALAELDRELAQVVTHYLQALGVAHRLRGANGAQLLEVDPDPRLPAGLQSGARVAAGAAPGTESLHLVHPLVEAAVRAAREADLSGPVVAQVPEDAHPELRERRGAVGRLVGLLAHHHGLESVDRLVPIVVFEGEVEPISPSAAAELLRLELRGHGPPLGGAVSDEAIEDAIDEVMFVERQALNEAEDQRFARSLEQIERFVEDRLFLLRRRRVEAERRMEEHRARRDAAIALDARERAEQDLRRTAGEQEKLEQEIDRLEQRQDETYQRCKDRLYQRRYAPARIEKLFDVELVLE